MLVFLLVNYKSWFIRGAHSDTGHVGQLHPAIEINPDTGNVDEAHSSGTEIRQNRLTDKNESSSDEPLSSLASRLNDRAPAVAVSYFSPKDIIPLPKAGPRKNPQKGGNRKRGSTRIVTNTPVRNTIAEEIEKKARIGKSEESIVSN
jgi:hypothetical protein